MYLGIGMQPSKELARTTTIDVIFPRLLHWVSEPDVPYQYRHVVARFGEIENIEEKMLLICVWANNNLRSKWYIRESSLSLDIWGEEKISLEFNFIEPEDQMAFKLMWS